MKPLKLSMAVAVAAVIGLSGIGWESGVPELNLLASPAQAWIGHPLTPLSYAGVARRSARRVARRTAIRVNSLPRSCVYGPYYGAHYYNCGGVYYEKSGTTYIKVVIE